MGGPVIDAEGKVIGVAVAAISGTDISFMIPAREMERFLKGSFDYWTPRKIRIDYDRDLLIQDMVVVLADPYNQIAEIGIHRLERAPGKNDLKPPFRSQGDPIRRIENKPGKEMWVQIELSKSGAKKIWYQIWILYRGAETRIYHAPFVPGIEGKEFVVDSPKPLDIKPSPPVGQPSLLLPEDLQPGLTHGTDWHKKALANLGKGLKISSPGPLSYTTLAGNGRYLVGITAQFGTIAVFDFKEMKWRSFLAIHGPYQLAAGGNRLALYRQADDLLEIYDLPSLNKIREEKDIAPYPFLGLGMGSGNARRLFMVFKENERSRYHFFLVDTKTLEAIPMEPPKLRVRFQELNHFFFDPTATYGVLMPKRGGDPLLKTVGARFERLGLLVNFDHRSQISSSGLLAIENQLFFRQEKFFDSRGSKHLLLAEDGETYLRFPKSFPDPIPDTPPTLHTMAGNQKIARLNFKIPYYHVASKKMWARQCYFFQKAGFVAYFGPYMEYLTIVPFQLDQEMEKQHEGTFLFPLTAMVDQAQLGVAYRQTLKHVSDSKVSYTLIEGPTGLKLSSAGEIHWPRPYVEKKGKFKIRFRLKNREQSVEHEVLLEVK